MFSFKTRYLGNIDIGFCFRGDHGLIRTLVDDSKANCIIGNLQGNVDAL